MSWSLAEYEKRRIRICEKIAHELIVSDMSKEEKKLLNTYQEIIKEQYTFNNAENVTGLLTQIIVDSYPNFGRTIIDEIITFDRYVASSIR